MSARPLQGVLLDIDGTILDSNDAHAQAWVDALRQHGRTVPFERVRPLIGMGGDKVVPLLTGLEEDSPEAKPLIEAKKRRFAQFLPKIHPFPGARALVERLRAEDLTVVVATSAGREEAKALLERAGIGDLLDDRTTKSDAESSKPDPDIVEAALRKGGLQPSEAVMIGDTPYDVEAARRAAVRTIAFRCGGWWDDDELAGALAIYDGPADLLARFAESPFVTAR
jgi:HAD superfamily hydrolase (TIGR01509 family)